MTTKGAYFDMSVTPYFMSTARLGFRRWREDDLDLALGLWGDPEVARFFDARRVLSREDVAERLSDEMAAQAEYGVQYWPVFLLAGGSHVGACGLRPYDPDAGVLELGVHIRSAHWGHGYATEAARAVIRHAFVCLGVKGLFAGHHPENEASQFLLGKLGFRHTHDEFYPPTGVTHPSYLLQG